jgi:hypothetical protein
MKRMGEALKNRMSLLPPPVPRRRSLRQGSSDVDPVRHFAGDAGTSWAMLALAKNSRLHRECWPSRP